MINRLDWKYIFTIVIAFAGVAVPIWLWQSDLSSKSLAFTVRSRAELQPQGAAELDGVQILVDGHPLKSPYVSVVELSNNGSKPIVATDFEGPIRISVTDPSQIVKARLTSSSPPALEPVLSLSERSIALQPLLLNPGDVIRFNLVTANVKPIFVVHGRVAGVSEIAINEAFAEKSTRRYWLAMVTSTLLVVSYTVNLVEFAVLALFGRTFSLWLLFTALPALTGAVIIAKEQDLADGGQIFGIPTYMFVAALISIVLAYARTYHRSKSYR